MCLIPLARRRGFIGWSLRDSELGCAAGKNVKLAELRPHRLLSVMDFTINVITPSDIPALLELIRELARFERLEHELEATPELLHNSLFGPQPAAGALLARSGGELAGYAIYFFTFSSFLARPGIWLEDVYVRPSFRHQGLGQALIQEVARVGVARDCGRYEWTALDWNENALDFYRKLGARALDEWVMLRLDAKGLRRVASVEAAGSSG